MEAPLSRFRQLRPARYAAVIGIAVLLGAADHDNMHVQIGDIGPLAQPEAAPARALTFHNTIYQAAPVPDEDVEAPRGSVRAQAQLSPKFISPNLLYEGDGYAFASSQQGAIERRKSAAAGLGLSVPVEQ